MSVCMFISEHFTMGHWSLCTTNFEYESFPLEGVY